MTPTATNLHTCIQRVTSLARQSQQHNNAAGTQARLRTCRGHEGEKSLGVTLGVVRKPFVLVRDFDFDFMSLDVALDKVIYGHSNRMMLLDMIHWQ